MHEESQPLYNTSLNTDIEVEQLKKKSLFYQIAIIILAVFVLLLGLGLLVTFIYFTTPTTVPFADTVNPRNILGHLKVFEQIAFNHSGSRTAASGGFNSTMDYIQSTLERLTFRYFKFSKQYLTIPDFVQLAPPKLSSGNTTFEYKKDFGQFQMSGSATIVNGSSASALEQGCVDANWVGFPAGSIALVTRGVCFFQLKVDQALKAKASAVILVNTDNTIFEGGLSQASTIPVLIVGKDLGASWRADPQPISITTLNRNTLIPTYNLFADTVDGDENNMIIVGAHSDGVPAGAGINDNGSGSATILETAIQFFREGVRPISKVRFAWWAAEELGLLGSVHYVKSLTEEDVKKIALNLNFDMLGSPNYYRGVYDGSGAAPEIRTASRNIQKVLEGYFKSKGLEWDLSAFDGRSDYGPFIERKIPAGGLAAGAEGIKTESQRKKFGGITGIAYDPCYHLHCDGYANISPKAIEEMGGNAAYATHFLATQGNLKAFLAQPVPAETGNAVIYDTEVSRKK